MISPPGGTSARQEGANEDPVGSVSEIGRASAHPSYPPTTPEPLSATTGGWSDEALTFDLRRVLAAIDGLPPKVEARPADRDDFDCSPYPEGDGRHDYRKTASSYDGTGLDHPDYRDGETCWRCRRCGDVFVAPDSEMAALDEERWWDGD